MRSTARSAGTKHLHGARPLHPHESCRARLAPHLGHDDAERDLPQVRRLARLPWPQLPSARGQGAARTWLGPVTMTTGCSAVMNVSLGMKSMWRCTCTARARSCAAARWRARRGVRSADGGRTAQQARL